MRSEGHPAWEFGANRAVELGGRVVSPPIDTPPVRRAVLADPQGAAFAVNTYTPATEPA
jgi:predicted enzyme related to lactoylglutathione lyase